MSDEIKIDPANLQTPPPKELMNYCITLDNFGIAFSFEHAAEIFTIRLGLRGVLCVDPPRAELVLNMAAARRFYAPPTPDELELDDHGGRRPGWHWVVGPDAEWNVALHCGNGMWRIAGNEGYRDDAYFQVIGERIDKGRSGAYWRPIETAPKGNVAERTAPLVDLWFPMLWARRPVGRVSNCFWLSSAGFWLQKAAYGAPTMVSTYGEPSHWMPAPESPA